VISVALNNREAATLIWMGIVALLLLTTSRVEVMSIIRVLTKSSIGKLIFGLFAYIALLVFLANRLGFWSPGLTFGALFWTASAGLPLLFLCIKRDPKKLRRVALGALSLTVLVEAFVNIKVLSLPLEIILLPFVTFFALVSAFVAGARKHELLPAQRFADRVLAIVGCALITYVLASVVTNWQTFDKLEAVRAALLPLGLTVGVAPFLVATWAYSTHDSRVVQRRLTALGTANS
jgi:hypothetical protein